MYMTFEQWLWRTLIDSGHIKPTDVKFCDLTEEWLFENLEMSSAELEHYREDYMRDCSSYSACI